MFPCKCGLITWLVNEQQEVAELAWENHASLMMQNLQFLSQNTTGFKRTTAPQ